MDYISILPDEITLQIFSKLNFQSILACFTVCKDWNNILSDALIWEGSLINDGLIRKEYDLCDLYHDVHEWMQLGKVMTDNILTNVTFEHGTKGWEVAGDWRRKLMSEIEPEEDVETIGEPGSGFDEESYQKYEYYLDTSEKSKVKIKKDTGLGTKVRIFFEPSGSAIEEETNDSMIKRSQKLDFSRIPKLQELMERELIVYFKWSAWVWPYNGRYQSTLVLMSDSTKWGNTAHLAACAKPDYMWSYEYNDDEKNLRFMPGEIERDYVYHELVRKNVRVCSPALQLRFSEPELNDRGCPVHTIDYSQYF